MSVVVNRICFVILKLLILYIYITYYIRKKKVYILLARPLGCGNKSMISILILRYIYPTEKKDSWDIIILSLMVDNTIHVLYTYVRCIDSVVAYLTCFIARRV